MWPECGKISIVLDVVQRLQKGQTAEGMEKKTNQCQSKGTSSQWRVPTFSTIQTE